MEQPTLLEVMKAIQDDANRRRNDAGFAGRMDDGGASQLEEQLKWFQYGIKYYSDFQFPKEWDEYVIKVFREKNPEWQKFKELAKMFKVKIPGES